MLLLAAVLIALGGALNFVTMASGDYTVIRAASVLLIAAGFLVLAYRRRLAKGRNGAER